MLSLFCVTALFELLQLYVFYNIPTTLFIQRENIVHQLLTGAVTCCIYNLQRFHSVIGFSAHQIISRNVIVFGQFDKMAQGQFYCSSFILRVLLLRYSQNIRYGSLR